MSEAVSIFERARSRVPFYWNEHRCLSTSAVAAFAGLEPEETVFDDFNGLILEAHILELKLHRYRKKHFFGPGCYCRVEGSDRGPMLVLYVHGRFHSCFQAESDAGEVEIRSICFRAASSDARTALAGRCWCAICREAGLAHPPGDLL